MPAPFSHPLTNRAPSSETADRISRGRRSQCPEARRINGRDRRKFKGEHAAFCRAGCNPKQLCNS
jgi:hypothetical protein